MSEQGKFLEELEAVKSIAASQDNKLTKDEVKKYLSDLELSDDKMEQVYYYLSLAGIEVEGYRFVPKAVDLQSNESDKNEDKELSDEETESEKHNDKKENNTSPKELSKKRAEYNNKLYMDEIGKLDYYDDAEERNLIQKFMDGDKNARNRFVENRLAQVVKIARNYADRENVKKGITGMDELIAEGNVGLLEAISVIEDGAIYMEVTNAIESLLDTVTSDKDWESAVLARTNLLNEAAKYMTEEMGRVPTKEELSEYTKIPVDEIRGIMGLSKDTQRIADTTPGHKSI